VVGAGGNGLRKAAETLRLPELIEEVLVQPAQQRPKGIFQRLRELVGLRA